MPRAEGWRRTSRTDREGAPPRPRATGGTLELDRDFKNCGTTVVLALLHCGAAYISWLGDSAAFVVTGERAEKLTWDHDWRTIFIRQRSLTEEEARHFHCRNPLVYYLGGEWPEGEDQLEILSHTPSPGDRLILATDGVAKILDNEAMLGTCRSHPEPRECAERLVALALERGSRDNCTCVVIAFEWASDGVPPELPQLPASPQPEQPRRWWQFWR